MPTIQFRTDDQTKAASTALFSQLGITMSEAINLFLRQSIMRGGIPFALTVPREKPTGNEITEDDALIDALRRYKAVNDHADLAIAKVEPFLQALRGLGPLTEPHITFYENAVKVRLNIKGEKYVIDYNFEEPETVFILSRQKGKLFVKDCDLAGIAETLELF
ncbi:type II toxin-antitoxin system RelB/DinJ family antitoxin [Treponema sp. TIM-1]|uniref:type II toxin-antitoxin system RelB/DinJ family antitoxin n=1 Tax=Treponema sp. TIM-1 TaxID=2898417 RepID=UPI00397EE079